MTVQALEIKRSSAAMWGTKTGLREKPVVSKYIDTTTCIGCKACEAACQEWNDLKTVATHQEGSYQTLPHLDGRNLLPAERHRDAISQLRRVHKTQ